MTAYSNVRVILVYTRAPGSNVSHSGRRQKSKHTKEQKSAQDASTGCSNERGETTHAQPVLEGARFRRTHERSHLVRPRSGFRRCAGVRDGARARERARAKQKQELEREHERRRGRD